MVSGWIVTRWQVPKKFPQINGEQELSVNRWVIWRSVAAHPCVQIFGHVS